MSVTAPPPLDPLIDETLDFLPLFPEMTEEKILGDWIAWANEGLDPVADADAWVDTREGSHWATVTMPMIRECARIWDLAGTEVPMSGFVLWAWETYLDDLAAVYEVERLQATQATGTVAFSGPSGTSIDAGTTVAALPSTPDAIAPDFEVTVGGAIGTGATNFSVIAVDAGSAGNVGAGAIQAQVTPLPDGVTFTNSVPTFGGTDVESDDALRTRILEAIAGRGPGAARDYVMWAGAWPGVGRVQVVPVWNGASTVLVMVADPNGLPLTDALVSALQQNLDPVAGEGSGTAPVGAHVTVTTSVLLNIDVTGTLTYLTGYSWDGSGGTVAVGAPIQAAITRYLLSVGPGGTVRMAHVAGILATWPGVDAATGIQMNAATADITLTMSPSQVAVLHSATF
jgi:uncharacterized phage protein gp47/JayE